ncbi:YqgE/AlgH family protein [Nocardioides sp. LHG3406-4]|uniref:YqgE/AlgH family protein n=1 Tax=Nocardioides sp. LHG3406-4 TaxID=2804575 RepID=UPI003CEB0817
MTDVAAGSLLVATPALVDPNFVDTVVLLLDVGADGALGVVLNRPSPVLVAEVLAEWRDAVAEPEVLFRGGPVNPDGALAVGRLADVTDVPVGFRRVFADMGVVDLDTPLELLEGSLAGLRIFAGYAGWGTGQVQREVDQGDWYVVPAEVADIFRLDSTDLWRDVLRRQPGELAWHSTRPLDPELN